jgi:hypothetical protein
VWLYLWASVIWIVGLVAWVAALILGRLPDWAHRFFTAYLRYSLHLGAYLTLAANPYPGFVGVRGSYPVDVEFAPPERQSRWTIFFRLLLALPALLLAGYGIGLLVLAIPVLAWFACLAVGRMPLGLRDALVYGLGYSTQTNAYLLLITPRYPNSDPEGVPAEPLPDHPVRLSVGDDLHRSRLTVFFRLLLFLPHLVWLQLWEIAAYVVALAGWFAALFTGRVPDALHRFLAAFVRYRTQAYAFAYLAANPFPGFVGARGSYPVEADVGGAVVQSRWITFFRALLALPANLVMSVVGLAAAIAAFLAWFAALFTGRMPRGLRNVIAWWLRYQAQYYAYLLLVTPRYPYSGPSLRRRPAPAAEPVRAPEPEAV